MSVRRREEGREDGNEGGWEDDEGPGGQIIWFLPEVRWGSFEQESDFIASLFKESTWGAWLD